MRTGRRLLLTAAGAMAATTAVGGRRAVFAQTPASGAQPADGLAYRSVGELRAMLDARQVSSVELVEQAITRITKQDARINAVVVRDFERAGVSAGEADAALARGERRPLLGIPMTVKELFNVAGLPTTWGLPAARDWRPAGDVIAVARLKSAGAVILGKTNIATTISDWQSFNAVYRTTNNPYDARRTPGGSSGGSAAALAAGYVALELGSDVSGSIRIPAHLCGVFGHKPSANLVPQRGHAPPRAVPLPTDLTSGLGVCGPMARTAADLALALDVLAGPDEQEATAWRLSLPATRNNRLAAFRVLVIDDHPLLPVASEIRDALSRLADRLAAMGASVARSSPLLPDLAESARLHTRMVRNLIAFGQPPEFFQAARERAAALKADDNTLMASWWRAPSLSHHDWMIAEIARGRLRVQWANLFKQFDVVLCPPFSVTAFPHDQTPIREERTIDIDGKSFPYPSLIVWATVATLPGLPATVMPDHRATPRGPHDARLRRAHGAGVRRLRAAVRIGLTKNTVVIY